jgi:eukaryotic-like serine/threonine-protein kinase
VVTTYSRGTVSYRAPELLNEYPLYTNKVDIWAFGCVVFEMATGKIVFQGDWDVRDFVKSNQKISFPQLRFCKALNEFLKDFIDACLLVDWQVRPMSLRDIYRGISKVFFVERTLFDDFLPQWPACLACRLRVEPDVVQL